LLLSAAGTLLLYTVSRPAFTHSFTSARYLVPLYTTLPLIFGVLWEAASTSGPSSTLLARARARWAPVWRSGPVRSRQTADARASAQRARVLGALAAAGLMLLFGCALYGAGATLAYAGDSSHYALPAPPADRQLLAALEAHGITRYVSDYWTCYRLVFESGERLRCGVRDGVNNTLTHNGAVNRYLPYLLEVERTPHPAYIFGAGSAWDTGFAGWAAAQHLPHAGYARLVVAGYAVYYYPSGQG
jgi:hypothetical protein